MSHHELCVMDKTMAEAIALQGRHVDPFNWVCICDRLRSCEARVRNADLQTAHEWLASRDEAWYAGVQAAREAVAALIHSSLCDCESCFWMKPALAAIDGVRGEQA